MMRVLDRVPRPPRRVLQLGGAAITAAGASVLGRWLDVASLLLIALVTAPLAGVILPRPVLAGGAALAVVIAIGLAALFARRSRHALLRWVGRRSLPAAIGRPLHTAIDEL